MLRYLHCSCPAKLNLRTQMYNRTPCLQSKVGGNAQSLKHSSVGTRAAFQGHAFPHHALRITARGRGRPRYEGPEVPLAGKRPAKIVEIPADDINRQTVRSGGSLFSVGDWMPFVGSERRVVTVQSSRTGASKNYLLARHIQNRVPTNARIC